MKDNYKFHKIVYISMTLLCIACYSVSKHADGAAVYAPAASNKNKGLRRNVIAPRFAVLPEKAVPGEYVTVLAALEKNSGRSSANKLKADLFSAGGKKIAGALFFDYAVDENRVVKMAFIAPPSISEPGAAVVKIENDGVLLGEIPLTILEKKFRAEIIPLNPANTNLRTEPDPKKTAEAARLWSIISTTGNDIWTADAFITPVPAETRKSSFFGDRRVYQYSNGKSDTSVHAGIDYAVPKGTPVKACAAGKVVLARPRIVTGNSVIIEHLPGVYSIYYHLDKINAVESGIVTAGEIIGLSGSTGLSTGPHLHWEVRVSTENADPEVFCSRAVIDSGAIIRTVFRE
jgi:hypothetical protein